MPNRTLYFIPGHQQSIGLHSREHVSFCEGKDSDKLMTVGIFAEKTKVGEYLEWPTDDSFNETYKDFVRRCSVWLLLSSRQIANERQSLTLPKHRNPSELF